MGEPAGIGPEVAVKAFSALGGEVDGRRLCLVGDPDIFRGAAQAAGLEAPPADALLQTGHNVQAQPGRPRPENAEAVTGAIAYAVRAAQAGEAAGLVTAPIHKAALIQAGFGFPGHTEFLSSLTGAKRPVMMLTDGTITPPLRVVPVTVHVPLRAVPESLTTEKIVAVADIVCDALKRDFGLARPRLAIAGLNPHAGEDGTLGTEDRDIIAPAVAVLRAKGHDAAGPLSADALFHDAARAGYDAVLCMYHDQALIPIKTLAFWTGVNVTLGLPIVRTSPDHGTAFDIAGKGAANAKSMVAAIEMAAQIARRRGL